MRTCIRAVVAIFIFSRLHNRPGKQSRRPEKRGSRKSLRPSNSSFSRWWTRFSATESWDSRKLRRPSMSLASWRKTAFKVEHGVAGHSHSVGGDVWIGQPVIGFITDIDCISAIVAEAGSGVSRSDHRRSAGTRRGPQLRHGGKRDGGAGSQTADGGAQDSRHAESFPRSRRRIAGNESISDPCRVVQRR